LLVVLFLMGAAHAADVDPFRPGSSQIFGVGTLQGESPLLFGEGPSGGLLAGFVQDPVVRDFADGSETDAVRAMLPLTLFGGYTLADRARIDVFLPIYAWVDAPVNDYSGGALGDLRVQGLVPAYTLDERFSFSVLSAIELPSGTRAAFTRRGLSGSLAAVAGGDIPDVPLGWVANLGLTGALADEVEGIGVGSTFDLLGGGWWDVQADLRVGAEIDLHAGLAKGAEAANTLSTAHVFAQQALSNDMGLTVGAGTGLISGLGAPEYRMVVGFHYAERVRDRDRDGLADDMDSCPDQPEDVDLFQDEDGCPDLDNDADGVVDLDDACPLEPEDADGFEDADGCPDFDNDGDGLADVDDACPDDIGTEDAGGCPDSDGDLVSDADDRCVDVPGFERTFGCPDSDLDGVADADDACPDLAKHPDEPDEGSDGCPKTAFATDRGIVIGERIEFASGSARIRRDTIHVLDAVAKVLRDHPEIQDLEIQGHTDDQGSPDGNLQLSQRRADAVRNYLISQDIAPSRLSAKGYGHTMPIDTNRTELGRKNNRRVEFTIATPGASTAAPSPESVAAPTPASAPTKVGGPGLDPDGAPGKLTVVVAGGAWANVYIDGKRLPKDAPFTDHELGAGSHELWVTNDDAGVDHRQTLTMQNGQLLRVVVPVSVGEDEYDPFEFDDVPDQAPTNEKAPWGDIDEIEHIPRTPTDGKRAPRGSKKK
jgi:outer membrane protein OmpA-like peptidoglycan-associated protein